MKTLITVLLILFNSSFLFALDIPKNKRIDFWIGEFTGSKRSFFQGAVQRSGFYRPSIIKIFKAEGLPVELSWLPLIESGFNCSAESKKDAAGCWQFIENTGKEYGLIKGGWTDQRYDFNKSTVAAARYLKWLHKKFGNWDLVLAAYNCGPTKVRKEIKKKGKDYWSLKLPKETLDYVPQFYAAVIISLDLKGYGFENSKGEIIIVKLRPGSHNLKYIANKILRVDYKEFARLNPGFEIGYTPPGESTSIYLMKNWDVSLLRGFGLLAKKNPLRVN